MAPRPLSSDLLSSEQEQNVIQDATVLNFQTGRFRPSLKDTPLHKTSRVREDPLVPTVGARTPGQSTVGQGASWVLSPPRALLSNHLASPLCGFGFSTNVSATWSLTPAPHTPGGPLSILSPPVFVWVWVSAFLWTRFLPLIIFITAS